MCQDCVDAAREFYPDCPDEAMGDFLFVATCFPFGTPRQVREQLEDMKAQGKNTWQEAMAYANELVQEAMAKLPIEDETHTTSPPGS